MNAPPSSSSPCDNEDSVDHQVSSDVLHYACLHSIRNIALNIFCKYFDEKQTFGALPSGCKEQLCGQILLWIVKGPKVILFREALTVLDLLQTAHPGLCPEKDWEKLKLGIQLKIILEQMLSGLSTSQCLDTFQQFFPAFCYESVEDDGSLSGLLYQLIKNPSEKIRISDDAKIRNEVGSNLIHTITHRVKHLVKNLHQRKSSSSSFIVKVRKDKMPNGVRKVYGLMEEGKLTSHQIVAHLEIPKELQEEKLFATIRRLFDSTPGEEKSACDLSSPGKNNPKRKPIKRRDVLDEPELNIGKDFKGLENSTPSSSTLQVKKLRSQRLREVRISRPDDRRPSSKIDGTGSRKRLERSCSKTNVTVPTKKINTPAKRKPKSRSNKSGCPLLCSERSSGSSCDESPKSQDKSSSDLPSEKSLDLQSAPLPKERSHRSSSKLSILPDGNPIPESFRSSKSPSKCPESCGRKQNIPNSPDVLHHRSKVRRVSECSSDSIEYFCTSGIKSTPESDTRGFKENIHYTENRISRTSSDNKATSNEVILENMVLRNRSDDTVQIDSAMHRQVCREIKNVEQMSSEESDGIPSSSFRRNKNSKAKRSSSQELLVVKSFYSRSLDQLKSYKWRSDQRVVKRLNNTWSAHGPLKDHLTAKMEGKRNRNSRERATRSPLLPLPRSDVITAIWNDEAVKRGSHRKGKLVSTSNGALNHGVPDSRNSPVFEFKHSSSGSSSSNPSISILTGRRILFSDDQDGIMKMAPRRGMEHSSELSLVPWSSPSGSGSSAANKSDLSSEELRFILDSLSEGKEDEERQVLNTPVSRNSLLRRSVLSSSSSSELQNAQTLHTLSDPVLRPDSEDSVPDSDEEDDELSESQTSSHARFPSLVRYLNSNENTVTLRPCRVILKKIKLEQMRLRVLLSQESQEQITDLG